MDKIGVMVCGHGSRSNEAVLEFANAVKQIPDYLPKEWELEFGYLEFANPVIRKGLDGLREKGCTKILAIPGMLFAAMHVKNDIPSVLNSYSKEHSIPIQFGKELGIDSKLLEASAQRIREALDKENADDSIPLSEACLVVIGRGASDPDANSNVSKVARLLQEGMGFGWCEVGYSGVTFPLVEPCLEHVTKLGYRKVVVFPYFLFGGILIDRIYGFTDLVAQRNPEIQFLKASYLNDHPLVLEVFADRAKDILSGDTAMNCSLCKYRTNVLGFEDEVGMKQESHHHHVEGQGASAPGSNVQNCDLCDDFCTGACRLQHTHDHENDHHHHGHHDHHHDHHHHPYPHSKHPLGPESVRKYLKD